MLGLEIRDTAAVAVLVDDRGQIIARAQAGPSDPMAAASDVLGQIAPSNLVPGAFGVASLHPDSPAVAEVVKALSSRFAGLFLSEEPVASGPAAAVAEAWIGAARDSDDVVYFSIGEHALSGVIRGRAIATGAHHRAPAVAWLALNPVDREDYRKIGCLEAEVAAAGIVRRLIWRIKAGDESRIQRAVGDNLAAMTIDHVLEGARLGDGLAISVVRDTVKYLGMAAANLVAIVDPQTLVLGGLMASSADLLFEPVRVEIARLLPPPMVTPLTIVAAALGDDAAAIGAARLAAVALQ